MENISKMEVVVTGDINPRWTQYYADATKMAVHLKFTDDNMKNTAVSPQVACFSEWYHVLPRRDAESVKSENRERTLWGENWKVWEWKISQKTAASTESQLFFFI